MISKEKKAEIVAAFGRTPADTGSPEVQIAILTERITELTEHLKARGYEAVGLHGDLTQGQRDTVMNLFRSGKTNILIATDVAARGIDVNDVEAVYNFDVPDDIEYYVHRIGRTGRAGKTGRSFTLVVGREAYKIRDIERICHTKIKERKVPNAADITARKAEKILKEAAGVIENEDISRAVEYILDEVALGQYSATQIAAAFMKMKLGDEIEDIRTEKFFFEKRPAKNGRGGRSGYGDKNGRGGRSGYGDKNGRGGKGGYGAKGSRDGRSGYGAKGSRDGYGMKGSKSRSAKTDRAGDGFTAKAGKSSYAAKGEKKNKNGGRRESDYEPRYGGLQIKTKWD